MKPSLRPNNKNFSSGPCAKRPGWSTDILKNAVLGRSHRSNLGKERLNTIITKSRKLLCLPKDYFLGIVPASDTGAVEMALWSILGYRGVDLLVWERFSADWADDVKNQLKINDTRVIKSDYGKLPDLSKVDFDRDVVFAWNGTTSGVRVPDGNWISDKRLGLTICDATSAAFSIALPWNKLDVVTYSWQKVLGGEGQHGVLILSPRAISRLKIYSPPWPIPKIFRIAQNGKLNSGIFNGETINTPSMLAVEDVLDSLTWVESVGGLNGLIKRTEANFSILSDWVEGSKNFDFLASRKDCQSMTSVCLKIVAPWFRKLCLEDQVSKAKQVAVLLEEMGIAYDIASYRDAPAGLRIWGGPTVESKDLMLLCPWIDWALQEVKLTLDVD